MNENEIHHTTRGYFKYIGTNSEICQAIKNVTNQHFLTFVYNKKTVGILKRI